MTPDDAWNKCRAIVIHGDTLAEKYAAEEQMED